MDEKMELDLTGSDSEANIHCEFKSEIKFWKKQDLITDQEFTPLPQTFEKLSPSYTLMTPQHFPTDSFTTFSALTPLHEAFTKEEISDLANDFESDNCVNCLKNFEDICLKPESDDEKAQVLSRGDIGKMEQSMVTCFGEQAKKSLQFFGEDMFNDVKDDNISTNPQSQPEKEINRYIFDELNGDLFKDSLDIFGDVSSKETLQLSEDKASIIDVPTWNLDYFSRNFADVSRPYDQGENLCLPGKGSPMLVQTYEHPDLSDFMNITDDYISPNTPVNLLNSHNCSNDGKLVNVPCDSVEEILNEDKSSSSTHLQEVSKTSPIIGKRLADPSKWEVSKKFHKKGNPSMNMIAVRRVKYVGCNLGKSEHASSAEETICFATHPAEKVSKKKWEKKRDLAAKDQKRFNSQRFELNDVFSRANGNEKGTEGIKTLVLPLGKTGCKVAIPASTSVDISSFFSQALKPKKAELEEKLISNNLSSKGVKVINTHINGKSVPLTRKTNHNHVKNDKSRSDTFHNTLINLKNVMKIEIYTKPPKRMIISKCNNQPGSGSKEKESPQSLKTPTSVLNKFINILRGSIPSLTDDILNQLCLPLDAVRRSYLTNIELVCVRKQAHLLTLLKRMKSAHISTCLSPCPFCSEIKSVESDLAELQKWRYDNILKAKSPFASNARMDSLGGGRAISTDPSSVSHDPNVATTGSNDKERKEGIETRVDLNLISENSFNEKQSKFSSDFNGKRSNAVEDEGYLERSGKARSFVSLENQDQNAERFQWAPRVEGLSEQLRTSERCRQWKKAYHVAELSRLVKNLEQEKHSNEQAGCDCEDGCRSVLSCLCCLRGLNCCDCRCVSCKNPLGILNQFSLDPFDVRLDSCLMQTIYDLSSNELKERLKNPVCTPCCLSHLPLYELVPNTVLCPNCSSFLSYSWCSLKVMSEESQRPRNHCVICRSCRAPLQSHCFVRLVDYWPGIIQ